MFLRGEIGETETGVGLGDANGGEQGEIETFGDGLGADDDIEIAVFDLFVERIEGFAFFVIGVETGNFGGGEEFS